MTDLKFDAIEVHPIRDYGEWAEVIDDDGQADFFGIFGRIDGDNGCYVPIGDSDSREAAELIAELLDNNKKGGLPQQS